MPSRCSALCEGRIIEKTRHRIDHAGLTWEIDVFHGANEGLVVAEVELDSADRPVDAPGLGRRRGDLAILATYNANLAGPSLPDVDLIADRRARRLHDRAVRDTLGLT